MITTKSGSPPMQPRQAPDAQALLLGQRLWEKATGIAYAHCQCLDLCNQQQSLGRISEVLAVQGGQHVPNMSVRKRSIDCEGNTALKKASSPGQHPKEGGKEIEPGQAHLGALQITVC